jgi:hypothetical protein
MNLIPDITTESPMEILLNAEQRLTSDDELWNFGDWRHCTCGHIYAAANQDEPADCEAQVSEATPHSAYSRALVAILEAAATKGLPEISQLAEHCIQRYRDHADDGYYEGVYYLTSGVSDITARYARQINGCMNVHRTHARTVIRWGIEHLEAQERENMEQAKKAKRTAPARKPNPVAEKLKQPV